MSDIFISYANEDKGRIKSLVAVLERAGWSVWWDAHIGVGEHFDEVIERQLKVAKCVIVVWSKFSVESRWVKTEAAEALERNILAPILIDQVLLPLEFKRIEAANLTDWYGDEQHPELRNLLKVVGSKLAQEVILATALGKHAVHSAWMARAKRALIVAALGALALFAGYRAYRGSERQPPAATAPAAEPVEWVETEQEPAATRSSGTACIEGSSGFDFDEGQSDPSATDLDFIHNNVDDNVRQMLAHRARLELLGNRSFESVDFALLKELRFAAQRVDLTPGAPGAARLGDVVAVRTSAGRYAKVQILQLGTYLKFKWLTYGTKEEGPAVGAVRSGPCSLEEDLGCGTGKLPGDAIASFTVASASKTDLSIEVSHRQNVDHGDVIMGAYLLADDEQLLNAGFLPTRVSPGGKTKMTIATSRPGRSKSLFVWLYERHKGEAFVCERFPYEHWWGR